MDIARAKAGEAFDAMAWALDDRTIDQQIVDALKQRIHLHGGLTLEVRLPSNETAYLAQHMRHVVMGDGYAYTGCGVSISEFIRDRDRYMDHVAVSMVMAFARERFLIKR